ncbi:MAG: hypothetical protein ACR2M0_16010 [Chloroflexia bacterium]
MKSFSATQLLSHARTPLYRNAYALTLSDTASSALGIVYWLLAARYYTTQEVGLSSAAISTMIFLSGVSQLNLRGALTRFIPCAGTATRRLIVYSYLASLLTALLVSTVFVLGSTIWASSNNFLGAGSDTEFKVWFVVATMIWCIFALQDGVLTGLRQTIWVPIENVSFGIAKILLLVLFVASFQFYGIFASWTIPTAISLIPVSLLIFRRLLLQHVKSTEKQAVPLVPRAIARFVAGDYLGALFAEMSTTLLPMLVVSLAGTTANAHFYLAWIIAYPLQLFSMNMAASLTVEGATDPPQLGVYSRRMLVQAARLLGPAVLAVLIGAPFLLSIFGSSYAKAGADLLRLLALSSLPFSINALYIGLARVQGRIREIVIVRAVLCALILGMSYFFLPIYGITGIGWAYLVSQTVVAGALLLTRLRPILRPHVTAERPVAEAQQQPLLEAVFKAFDSAGVKWCVLRGEDELGSLSSDRDIDLLMAAQDIERVMLLLRDLDFAPLPSWGFGPHNFFLRYHRPSDCWIKLDIVTDLDYGSDYALLTGAAGGCLKRRRRQGSFYTLAPDDAFWTLLLHCLLDKGRFATQNADRLQQLVGEAHTDGQLAEIVGRACPAGWDTLRLLDTVRCGDWAALAQLASALREGWVQGDPVGVRRRALVNRAFHLGAKLLVPVRRRGLSVALLGPDGAGKSTLAGGLQTSFYFPVRSVYMGLWQKDGAHPLLARVPGWDVATRPFTIWSRYLTAQYHQAMGRLVIFDRYTYDALLPPGGPFLWMKRPYFWLLAHACPAPDLVLVLDAPGEVMFARKGEETPAELEAARQRFLSLQERIPQLEVVDVTRPQEAVRVDVVDRIWQCYVARWSEN